jgi:hypothetical protein
LSESICLVKTKNKSDPVFRVVRNHVSKFKSLKVERYTIKNTNYCSVTLNAILYSVYAVSSN